MARLSERIWKHRFAAALGKLFEYQGLNGDDALEDAYAHADDQFPRRTFAPPEQDAQDTYRSLMVT